MSISVDQMASLAKALLAKEALLKEQLAVTAELNKSIRLLKEETIPGAMHELGLESLTLSTGQKLSIKQEVYASIPNDQKKRAFLWLQENGFGGLIKSEVVVAFGRGALEDANELMTELQESGMSPEFKESVHASTLKAFLRDEITKGTKLDLDMFGARPVWTSKIK